MMEPSFDRHEDVVVGFGDIVSGGKKGVVMESGERISTDSENGVDCGSRMRLDGEVTVSAIVDDAKFGANQVNYSEMRALNLVVDLSQCSRKESGCNVVKSRVKKANDVNFSENDGEYELSDLVWVKMKNHQWWPAQIINTSASTDEAMNHFKKDGFHIAYFGNQKFAFKKLNDIKPFRLNFCKFVNQSNGEAFIHAVNHALCEAARRIEFGLSCLCLSEDVYDKIKSQIVVNSVIRKEISRIDDSDRFLTLKSFNPAKTVELLHDLAKDPFGINRLDVLTVRGQVSAFNRLKGYHQLQLSQLLDEEDGKFDVTNSAFHSKGKLNSRKRKHLFDGGFSPIKKVRCLSELMMLDGIESVSDVEYKPKKRGRKRKVIEFNGYGDESQSQSQTQIADEFLSQIYLTAKNPTEGQHNLDSLVKFSFDFNNYRLRENKKIANQPEITETDSYSTDMTIVTKSDIEKSATALTFKFTNLERVPSVKKLHEIFRRYGALQETESRVLKKKKCVKLVFERKCDAETAFSSTGKFSIFGPALVSYRLNYSPKLKKKQQRNRGLKHR